jgi:hypothetical protein
MASQKLLQSDSRAVAADYSAKQFYLMDINTSDQWVLCSAQGQRCFGALQDKPDTAGDHGTVETKGITKVVLGGTVAQGDPICSDSAGKAIKATAQEEYVIGRMINNGVVNDIYDLLITHEGFGSAPQSAGIMVESTTFTAAQVIASNATPLVLVDYSAILTAGQIATGDVLIFHDLVLEIHDGSANYGQNQNFIVKYQTAGGGATVSTTLANFANGAADGALSTCKQLTTDVTPEAAQDLVLTSSASPKNAAGDRLMTAHCYYSVVTPV